jgi:tetratricopeptide (TPR) repeat protein
MVAELRDVWPDLDEPAELPDAKQARFRLLEAVGLWLTRACGSSPMVVIIEDVHAADSDSLTMLGYVAGELARLPVLVVVTHRDSGTTRTADLTGALAELSRATSPERIALGGLDENAVSEYIRLTLGEDVAERLAAQVYSRTDGNPLFVSEIVRLLEASVQTGGADDAALLVSTVPEGVRAAIGQRVATLSQASRDLLEFASVIGREFSFDQVEALRPELGGEELLDAFDEALESGLLEEAPQAVGYRFAHALIRDALLDGLSRRRRARLEAEVADGLESFYGARADDHAAELARHYAEAEPILGDAKLITYSRAAAERALAMHAYEEAMVHARRALESDPDEAPADSNAAAMLFLLARAELGALELYELGGALGRMAAAFEFYCDAGDRASALEIATHPVPPLWERTAAPVMLDRALEMVEPDSLAAGQLSASKGWFIGAHDGDYAGAEAAFGRALEIAERLDDPELERRSVVTQAQVDYWHMHWSECGERGERAIRLSQEAGDARTEMIAREWPARVAAIRGDPGSAVQHAAAAVGLAERLRERHELATACMYFGWLRSLTGRWEQARDLSDRALDLQPREPRNLATRAILELQTGNTAEGESQLQRLLDPERQTTWGLVEKLIVAAFVPMARRITEGDSGLDTAETSARAVLATPMPPLLHLYPRLGLALLAIMRDDRELAREAYEGLVGQRGTVVIMASIATDRILGSLAAMAGNPAGAREHFEQALALCERAGYLPELAWTAADFAEVLARAGSDRPRAAELREQALALAERISMEPLRARVEHAPR